MLSLFRPRLPVDEEELEFLMATFKWLVGAFGPASGSPLVLPTPAFFPSLAASRRPGPADLFEDVRRAADMADWPCRLEAGEPDLPVDAGNDHLLRHEGGWAPCGTFRIEPEAHGATTAVITYNPDMANDQEGLVATFAHELAHYLLASASGPGPGGWDLNELHTDVAAVYLGFGIFLANNARSFHAFQEGTRSGWSSRLQGYLGEGALATCLVIFQRLAGRDPAAASPFLEGHLQTDLRRADRVLAKRFPDMTAAIDAVDLSQFRGA